MKRKELDLGLNDIVSQIRPLIVNNTIASLKLKPQDLFKLARGLDRLGAKESEEFWKKNEKELEEVIKSMKKDFSDFLESSREFFGSSTMVKLMFNNYNKMLEDFLKEQFKPQEPKDTRSKAWMRYLPERTHLADSLSSLTELVDRDSNNPLFPGYHSVVSQRISLAAMDGLMHPEFESKLDDYLVMTAGDDRYKQTIDSTVNKRQSENTKIKQGRIVKPDTKTEKEIKTRATDLNETLEMWKGLEQVV